MALERKDAVGDASTTTGTGTLTLVGTAPAGRRTFAASGLTTGATVRYRIALADESEWETGEGVWTSSGATLSRVTVYASSNSGSLVNFSAGTKNVSIVSTAADFATYIGCQAYNSAAQVIANSTSTPVTFDSESWDTSGIHSTSSNTSRFTVPSGMDGKWQFSWSAPFASGGSGQRIGWLRKNAAGAGSDTDNVIGSIDVKAGSSYVASLRGTTCVTLAAGDYIELFVYHDSGSSRNLGNSTGGSTNSEVAVMEARFLG